MRSDDAAVTSLGMRHRVGMSDVIASLQLVPPGEIKRVTLAGTFPVPVLTRLLNPVAVYAAGCAKHGGGVGDGSDSRAAQVAWRLSGPNEDPGVWLTDVTGPTWEAGVEWDVVLVMLGEVA